MRERKIESSDVGFLWLSTQGFEGYALDGARGIAAANVPVFIKFWTYALKRSGDFDLLMQMVAKHYAGFVVASEYDKGGEAVHKPGELPSFFADHDHDHVFLVK